MPLNAEPFGAKERVSMELEISRGFRAMLMVSLVALLAQGTLYTFFAELQWQWVDWPFKDPVFYRFVGVTLLTAAAGCALMLRERKWAHVRVLATYSLIWVALFNLVNLWSIVAIPFDESAIQGVIFDTVLTFVFTCLYAYFFVQHSRLYNEAQRAS